MKCEFCGKGYNCNQKRELERFNSHVQHCKSNPNRIKYKCKYCDYENLDDRKISAHLCELNPNYEKILKLRIANLNGKSGWKHSEKTKSKISKIRIDYLLKNPDKVPYRIEKYFSGF